MNAVYPSYCYDMRMEVSPFKQICLSRPSSDRSDRVHELGVKKVYLKEGEELLIEPGTMLACKNVTMKTEKAGKTLWEMVKRYLLGQEQLFVNRIKGNKCGAWISFEEAMDEEIAVVPVKGEDSKLQIAQGSFLASSPNILLSLKNKGIMQLLRSMYVEPIMFNVQSANGKEGHLFFSSNNSQIKRIDMRTEDGSVYIDSQRLVAILGDLQIQRENEDDSYLETLLSGEGIMYQFKGQGTLYLGSRASDSKHPVLVNVAMSLFEKILPYTFLAPLFGLYQMYIFYSNTECDFVKFGRRPNITDSVKRQCNELCKSRSALDTFMRVVTKEGKGVIECCCKVNKIASFLNKKFVSS